MQQFVAGFVFMIVIAAVIVLLGWASVTYLPKPETGFMCGIFAAFGVMILAMAILMNLSLGSAP